MEKVTLNVIDVVTINQKKYFECQYNNRRCAVKLHFYDILQDKVPRTVNCIKEGENTFVRDEEDILRKVYTPRTKITLNNSGIPKFDDNSNTTYYNLKDKYGISHRLYIHDKDLPEGKKISGEPIDVWIKDISNGHLILCLTEQEMINQGNDISNAPSEVDYISKKWYSAEKVFSDIKECDFKESIFNDILNGAFDANTSPANFQSQYQRKNNLWIFSFINSIEQFFLPHYLEVKKLVEARKICEVAKKLQSWILEGSDFLNNFGEETRTKTIQRSTSNLNLYNNMIDAIDIVSSDKTHTFFNDKILFPLINTGTIRLDVNSRHDILMNIFKIYPTIILQDISFIANILQALSKSDFLDERDWHLIRKTFQKLFFLGYQESGLNLLYQKCDYAKKINDITRLLNLLGLEILVSAKEVSFSQQEVDGKIILEERLRKAKFMRILSYVAPSTLTEKIINAGIYSLIGTIDTTNVFQWDNFYNIDISSLSKQIDQAPILESNVHNNYVFSNGNDQKGLVLLTPAGFRIIPAGHCKIVEIPEENLYMTKQLYHSSTLPLCIDSYLDASIIERGNKSYTDIYKDICNLYSTESLLPKNGTPVIGDTLTVKAKKSSDNTKIIFVTSIDPRYPNIEGAIHFTDISTKHIDDVRDIIKTGDIIKAKIKNIESCKYVFTIKDQMSQVQTSDSSVLDDYNKIRVSTSNSQVVNHKIINKDYINELILLIQHLINIYDDTNTDQHQELLLFAQLLSAITYNKRSYYYSFLFKYYAYIENFVTRESLPPKIEFDEQDFALGEDFPDLAQKINVVKQFKIISSLEHSNIKTLFENVLQNENSTSSKLSAQILALYFAKSGGCPQETIKSIKNSLYLIIQDMSGIQQLEKDVKAKENLEERTKQIAQTEIPTVSRTCELPSNGPLYINISKSSSTSLDDETHFYTDNNIIKTIEIPEYARNGIIILVNNNSRYIKLKIADIIEYYRNGDSLEINPYQISFHYVLPENCIYGLIFTIGDSTNIAAYKTADLNFSTCEQMEFKSINKESLEAFQPFVLPYEEEYVSEILDKETNSNNISIELSEYLNSYNINIKQ